MQHLALYGKRMLPIEQVSIQPIGGNSPNAGTKGL
jgi:hypothetical protein